MINPVSYRMLSHTQAASALCYVFYPNRCGIAGENPVSSKTTMLPHIVSLPIECFISLFGYASQIQKR